MLLARAAQLDKECFKAKNELLILKREISEGKFGSTLTSTPQAQVQSPMIQKEPIIKEVVKEVAPKAMLDELENLKLEKQHIWDEKEQYRYENEQMKVYQEQLVTQNNTLTQDLSQVKDELAEAESVVQECVEVKLNLHYKKFVYILISRKNFFSGKEKIRQQ